MKWPKGQIDFSYGAAVMGILNVTPDSFSDGGQWFDINNAVKHGIEMEQQGAAIIDIGAESTRPGAERVPPAEQIKRAIPVIKKLASKINIPISIDTQDYQVAKEAVAAGASIINDITACNDEAMLKLVAEEKLPIVLMHMQGTPQIMQKKPSYNDVVGEVLDFLIKRTEKCIKGGINKEMIIIDPGIGFGKTAEHNIELLKNLDKFVNSGFRVLVGTSRKKFIGQITGKNNPAERVFATAATVAIAAAAGVAIIRAHDIPEMMDVIKVANKLRKS